MAGDAIIVVDVGTGLIVDANRKAGDLVGLPRGKPIGLPQLDLHSAEERDRFA